ncbi:MAG: hypothetical protein HWN71_06785 [Desulfobacterales bacterium]|nr:hypothetical protein [Desulfobacterales bacterium]
MKSLLSFALSLIGFVAIVGQIVLMRIYALTALFSPVSHRKAKEKALKPTLLYGSKSANAIYSGEPGWQIDFQIERRRLFLLVIFAGLIGGINGLL